MSVGRYLLGVLFLVATVVPLGLGAFLLRERLLAAWSGAPARLAEAVLALSALIVLSELLGVAGAFRAIPLLVACACFAGAAYLFNRRAGPHPSSSAPAGEATSVGLLLAAGATALVFAQWTARLVQSLGSGMPNVDTLGYHGPFAARFAQDGSVTPPNFTSLEPLHSYLPANSELLNAVGILAFGTDFATPFLNHGALALALLAGWCIGRPFGVGPATLVGVAIVLSAPAISSMQPGDAMNDALMLAFFLTSVALIVCGDGRRAAVLVAGLAGGLAVGTKITAIAPVAAILVALVWLSQPGRRLAHAGIYGAAAMATGAFWYIRNLAVTGNPLPWINGIGPISLPGIETPHIPALSEYLFDTALWERVFIPGLRGMLGPAWPVVVGAATAGAALAIVRGTRLQRGFGAAVVICAVAYVFTPASAGADGAFFALDLRYLSPALALGLALLPTAGALLDARRREVWLITAAALLVSVQFARDSWIDVPVRSVLSAAVVLAVAGAALVVSRRRWRAGAVAAGVATLALGVCVDGWQLQKIYRENRYAHPDRLMFADFPGGRPLGRAYVWARRVEDARIAVFGPYHQYPFYGPNLSNRIRYLLRRGANGDLERIASCREWTRALGQGRFDYLVITPVHYPWEAGGALPELEWTRSMRDAKEVLRARRLSIFRLDRAPDSRACKQRAKRPRQG